MRRGLDTAKAERATTAGANHPVTFALGLLRLGYWFANRRLLSRNIRIQLVHLTFLRQIFTEPLGKAARPNAVAPAARRPT